MINQKIYHFLQLTKKTQITTQGHIQLKVQLFEDFEMDIFMFSFNIF